MSLSTDAWLVQPTSFLKWIREEAIENHMNDGRAKASSNHSNYRRLAQNSHHSMQLGAKVVPVGGMATRSVVVEVIHQCPLLDRSNARPAVLSLAYLPVHHRCVVRLCLLVPQ